jgi:ABC-type uncharacterized transport system substrate-binding protein
MTKSLLRLSLGVFLIVAASAVLLLTDKESQRINLGSPDSDSSDQQRIFSVALFQHVSHPIMEDGAKGVIAGLAAAGYRDGDTIRLRRFNAEGDAATSSTIARELVGGGYNLIITLSTASLQAVAGANRDAKLPHVFGLVSDPVAAGVGIARDDPMKHPPYMVGIGTMQPVAEAFRMARELAPKLARVGVAWNPSEANSEACTKVARAVCRELKIELLEANVDNSAGVREAVGSVIARGAEAIWVGGDATVLASLDSVIGPARSAGIPVFSNTPGCSPGATLFDLGADFYQVGGKVGELAGRVLDGESPASMPTLYELPSELWINQLALGRIKAGWSFPKDVQAKADVVVEQKGPVRIHPRVEFAKAPGRSSRNSSRPSRLWKIGLISSADAKVVEETYAGLRKGLTEAGLVDGRDYKINYRNAQGDIATLNSICDEMSGDDTDLVIALTTTGLQAALRKIERKPLLFALVLNPFACGAGKSDTDHRPNVTGVYLAFPYAEVASAIREVMPRARRVGTLFTPGELNSVIARQRFEDALKKEGLSIESKPVNAPSEVTDAAFALCQSNIDVFCQLSDGLTNASFPAIARACESTKMPLFSFASGQITVGAVLTVGSDYEDNGREAGLLAARVVRGESPTGLPFQSSKRVRRCVNLDNARRYGVAIPAEWLEKADVVLPAGPNGRRPAGTK